MGQMVGAPTHWEGMTTLKPKVIDGECKTLTEDEVRERLMLSEIIVND